jgi:hypothetical protein
MSSFKATMTVAGTDYDVVSCVYSFGQATDDKGRPASDVKGGSISVQIVVTDDDSMVEWMIDPYKKQDGSITFMKIDQDSKLKEIKFTGAYLVGYSESFNANSSSAMIASLNISAGTISVDSAKLDNKWS